MWNLDVKIGKIYSGQVELLLSPDLVRFVVKWVHSPCQAQYRLSSSASWSCCSSSSLSASLAAFSGYWAGARWTDSWVLSRTQAHRARPALRSASLNTLWLCIPALHRAHWGHSRTGSLSLQNKHNIMTCCSWTTHFPSLRWQVLIGWWRGRKWSWPWVMSRSAEQNARTSFKT